jgi:hypothetical protein
MLIQTQGHSAAGRIMSMKNSDDTIGNRTRDLLTCSAVPRPTVLPCAPWVCLLKNKKRSVNCMWGIKGYMIETCLITHHVIRLVCTYSMEEWFLSLLKTVTWSHFFSRHRGEICCISLCDCTLQNEHLHFDPNRKYLWNPNVHQYAVILYCQCQDKIWWMKH